MPRILPGTEGALFSSLLDGWILHNFLTVLVATFLLPGNGGGGGRGKLKSKLRRSWKFYSVELYALFQWFVAFQCLETSFKEGVSWGSLVPFLFSQAPVLLSVEVSEIL